MSRYNTEGSIWYAIIFVIMFIILSFIFIIMLPMCLTINTSLWMNSQGIYDNGLLTAGRIQDVNISNAVAGCFTSAQTSFVDSQTIIGLFTQYGWILIVIVVITLIILLARRQVETAKNRGVI